jgi:hypothetical protein
MKGQTDFGCNKGIQSMRTGKTLGIVRRVHVRMKCVFWHANRLFCISGRLFCNGAALRALALG